MMMKLLKILVLLLAISLLQSGLSLAEGYPCAGILLKTSNVRKEASQKSDKLGEFKNGETVTVIGEQTSGGTMWYQVEFGNRTGYVRSDLIQLINGASQSAPSQSVPSQSAPSANGDQKNTLDVKFAPLGMGGVYGSVDTLQATAERVNSMGFSREEWMENDYSKTVFASILALDVDSAVKQYHQIATNDPRQVSFSIEDVLSRSIYVGSIPTSSHPLFAIYRQSNETDIVVLDGGKLNYIPLPTVDESIIHTIATSIGPYDCSMITTDMMNEWRRIVSENL